MCRLQRARQRQSELLERSELKGSCSEEANSSGPSETLTAHTLGIRFPVSSQPLIHLTQSQRQYSIPILISVDSPHPIQSNPVFLNERITLFELRELALELHAQVVHTLNAHFSAPLHNLHTFTSNAIELALLAFFVF